MTGVYPADPRPKPLVKANTGKAAGVGAAALALACAMIAGHEGEVRRTYVDKLAKGSPLTYCYGSTAGAVAGKTYTHQECLAALQVNALRHAQDVQACLPAGLPDQTAAAFYDLGYNVGARAFCFNSKGGPSTLSARAKAGDLRGACNAISLYVYSNGKDCRLKASGCGGIVKRRADEVALCLSGLTNNHGVK